MFQCVVLIILAPILTNSISYTNISQAQLITKDSLNIWLYNQSSSSQCMCQALQYKSPSIAAFNVFPNNQTCQLILNNFSNSTSFYIMPSLNSTIFILIQDVVNRLKSICCSDLSWLMNQIQKPMTFANSTITKPVGLTLDENLNMLIVTYGTTRQIQQRDLTNNMSADKHLFAKTNTQPVSYHDGLYYAGINPPAASSSNYFYIYNSNLTRIKDISFPQGDPQRAVWLYNNSIMCLIIQQNQTSSLVLLNWFPLLLNFTYNRTISVPFDKPYGLPKSNDDTMIYVSGNLSTIYQLSTVTFIWSILVSNNNSTEIPMSLFVDICGNRLWVLMLGFGIRIYDRIQGNELASWNMSASYPTLYDMIITSGFELYLIDSTMNQLIHYGTSLQGRCTIN